MNRLSAAVCLLALVLSLAWHAKAEEKEGKKEAAPPAKPEAAKEAKKPEEAKKKEIVAFAGGRVVTGTGRQVDPGVVLVEDGKITAVGARSEVTIPPGATTVDTTGYWIAPGTIVVRSTQVALTGRGEWGERFDRFHPEAELLHALGITAYYASEGRATTRLTKGNAVIRVVRDRKEDTVLLKSPAAIELDYASARPSRRQEIKESFVQAKKWLAEMEEYHKKLEQYTKDLDAWTKREAARKAAEAKKEPAKEPVKKEEPKKEEGKKEEPKKEEAKDPRPEAPKKPAANEQVQLAADLLQGKVPLRVAAERTADLERIVTLCREFGLRPIVDGASEGWTMVGELASVGSRAIVTPRSRLEPRVRGDTRSGWTIENAARLDQGGVRVATCPSSTSFGYWGVTGDDLLAFRITPAFLVRGGLSNEKAFAAITSEAARILGVDSQIGSLEPGRFADLLFLTGDPMHYRTLVEKVYMSGRLQYERDKSTWFRHIKPQRD